MIFLREVKPTDLDMLFRWTNDPIVRQNSFSIEPIAYDKHVEWFTKMINDDSILKYIMMKDETPIGQIRLKLEDGMAEISYSIAPEYRGHGYGHKILQLVEEKAKEHTTIKKLVAKVKPDNVASNKLFLDEDYKLDYLSYSRNLI